MTVIQAKLRPVGNSVELTIPASELNTISAKAGDVIELEIKRVVRHVRADWDNVALWQGADEEPILLKDVPEPPVDGHEWE